MPVQNGAMRVTSSAVKRVLCVAFGTLFALHVLTLVLQHGLGFKDDLRFSLRFAMNLFDFGGEQNIPTLFSVCMLLYASTLSTGATLRGRVRWGGWALLAVVFAYLALDEFAEIHESIGTAVSRLLDTSGVFYYG